MIDYRRDLDIVFSSPVEWTAFKDSKILVTGATGRLGIYLIRSLLEANKRFNLGITILALARKPEKVHAVLGDIIKNKSLNVFYQDINMLFEYNSTVDYIFHTAGQASPSDYVAPVDTLWGHVNGTHNILEFARKHDTRKILYVSTVEVYGDWKSEYMIKESDMGPLFHAKARACYPEAKRLCETMLASYQLQYGIDYTVVRMSHTIGAGVSLTDGRGFAEFIDTALKGKDIILHSDGRTVRTYTYTADAIGGMFTAFTKGNDQYYNIANSNNELSILELANLIASLVPKPVQVKFDSSVKPSLSYLPYKIGILDASELKKLGWQPQVNVHNTLLWTIESFL